VSVIDIATNTVIATIPVEVFCGGSSGVAVAPDGSKVYVASGCKARRMPAPSQ
jgi:DNA-binding beta-propeller fold protein YncE